MSNPPLVPTDAEQLLSILKRSTSEPGRAPDTAAVYFDPAPPQAPPPQTHEPAPPAQTQTPDDRLRAAELALEAAAQALGSLPPFPATLRGRIGRILIRLVHRAIWWPLSTGRQVAFELSRVVRTQREQYQSLDLRITELATVLHAQNVQLQALGSHVASRIPGETPRPVRTHSRRAYLPLLLDAAAGTEDAPVLDLPCGRGEWLNLLRNEHRKAYGVDASPQMVAACTSQGLHAIEAQPLSYLATLPTGGIGAVTSFQAIDTWPIGSAATLVEQAFRVLKPHGLLILETSTPAVPADLLQHIVETRGFQHVRRLDFDPHYAIIGVRP